MKTIFLALFMAYGFSAKANSYYFSTQIGDDSRTNLQAQNPLTPWKTISRLNSVFASLQPGDFILFNRGEIFYGAITISRSGFYGLPITIGAYGSGEKPIITGFTTVSAWTNLGSNIWESTGAVSSLATTCNMVTINGVNTARGRYPNTGYLTYQSFQTNTSITSSSLNSAVTNWTGAQIVIRKERWIIDVGTIRAHSVDKITYSGGSVYNGNANYGFFIQNDSKTLDTQNEWYYNLSTKKISVYNPSQPTDVKLATVDTLVYMTYKNYITFDNLQFTGANASAIYAGSCNNLIVQNCNFNLNYNGIISDNWGNPANNALINNNTFNNTNNNGIRLSTEFTSAIVTNNLIQNTGMLVGMSGSGDGNAQAISADGSNSLVQYNRIINTGYIGITFKGNNTQIKNNFINNFCVVKDDGGGIYAYGNMGTSGRVVSYNTIINGVGNTEGAPGTAAAIGIYLDNSTAGVDISYNNITNIADAGIFLHDANNNTTRYNTVYNCAKQIAYGDDDGSGSNNPMNNNIMVARTSSQYTGYFQITNSVAVEFGDASSTDNNYYARPIDDNLTINEQGKLFTLEGWKTFSGRDANSHKSPKTITDINDLRFEYNETSSPKTISLPSNYIDVKGVNYNGIITLAPYSSAVLIKNGNIINLPPIVNAGQDQTITLPLNTVLLSGSGTDTDGSISSYNWTTISGPSNSSITNAASLITSVTALIQGVYKFELKATDNNGAVARDTIQVIVNAAANQSPVANAGFDQKIVLPVNSITLSGSGSDADGNITSYNWTKISGPSSGSISNAFNAITAITGLVQGVYKFELKVTDNNGATATKTIQVIVNAATATNPTDCKCK